MGKTHHILGVDVGGTGIKGGIVDVETGQLLTARHRIDTPKPATPKAVAKTFKQLVEFFDYEGPIGVGFPAIVHRGVARSAANVADDWIGTSIVDVFTKATKQPVYALNDADAAGVAAIQFGAGQDYLDKTVLMLTIGTGIGSGLFVDGELVPNTEMGHLYLKNHKAAAEKYVSNLLRKSNQWPWSKFGKRLNKYLEHVDFIFSPDLILIGGGVSKNFTRFSPYLKLKTEVKATVLGNNAGTIGAAYYAYKQSQSS